MNAMPKYVASRTLRELRWENSVLLGADLADEVTCIKAASEADMLVLGSGGLLGTLIEYGPLTSTGCWFLPSSWAAGSSSFPMAGVLAA